MRAGKFLLRPAQKPKAAAQWPEFRGPHLPEITVRTGPARGTRIGLSRLLQHCSSDRLPHRLAASLRAGRCYRPARGTPSGCWSAREGIVNRGDGRDESARPARNRQVVWPPEPGWHAEAHSTRRIRMARTTAGLLSRNARESCPAPAGMREEVFLACEPLLPPAWISALYRCCGSRLTQSRNPRYNLLRPSRLGLSAVIASRSDPVPRDNWLRNVSRRWISRTVRVVSVAPVRFLRMVLAGFQGSRRFDTRKLVDGITQTGNSEPDRRVVTCAMLVR